MPFDIRDDLLPVELAHLHGYSMTDDSVVFRNPVLVRDAAWGALDDLLRRIDDHLV
ncbi:hypothetical protein D3C76_1706230 [compost metagenome]